MRAREEASSQSMTAWALSKAWTVPSIGRVRPADSRPSSGSMSSFRRIPRERNPRYSPDGCFSMVLSRQNGRRRSAWIQSKAKTLTRWLGVSWATGISKGAVVPGVNVKPSQPSC